MIYPHVLFTCCPCLCETTMDIMSALFCTKHSITIQRSIGFNILRGQLAQQLEFFKCKYNKAVNTNMRSISCCHCSQYATFSLFTVPETLDRKHFHQEGMCVHTSSVKGPPQVCAWTYCSVPCGDSHGNSVIAWCVLK